MDQQSSGVNQITENITPGGALFTVRKAIRAHVDRYQITECAVALSGGADSLALTAAAVAEGLRVQALVVDHQLQEGSVEVARRAAEQANELGCHSSKVLTVEVVGAGGLEAAARNARYAALTQAREGRTVLLAHTLDDQAETVLLGLGRGSGPRSIAGMRDHDEPWSRPLLGVRRWITRAACMEVGMVPYEDPHNCDPRFTRVRLRTELLPLLEEILDGGVAQALARTAQYLQEDNDYLDELAESFYGEAKNADESFLPSLDIATLAVVPATLRRRVLRQWLRDNGAKNLTDKHIRAVDVLISDWKGQGGVAVGGGKSGFRLVASRKHGRLLLELQENTRL
ncbi:MAG: tRNA lysidine(34) synthetase TilS [Mycobacteriaceae bacterium]